MMSSPPTFVADVIKGMAPLFPSFLKDNGILILSGIITERADRVLDTVTAYDFAVLERREASGWCAVCQATKACRSRHLL